MAKRLMHLMAYLKTGATSTHPGGWRHPEADLDDIFLPSRYEHIAQVLERSFFDGCFYADTQGVPDIYNDSFAAYIHHGGQLSYLDPLTVLPIMAAATRHLGLGATLSTTFHHPYHLARTLASLDLLSNGRACWNVVTSSTDFEARNFGMEKLPEKDLRYDIGDEVLEACCALWDCWEPDAFIMDKRGGVFADAAKVRYADYRGKYVSTRGPLSLPRSPQGRPVLMQAGASSRGRAFAARWAEAIFCGATGVAACVEFYADIKSRMKTYRRSPEQCAILPAISVVLGETESIARERADYLDSLISPELLKATGSAMLGADLGKVRSAEELASAKGSQGHGGLEQNMRRIMQEQSVTLEEANRRSHRSLIGTPVMIADAMQEIFDANGCDGFVLQGNVSPGMFEEFGRMVVPELQNRGLLRTAYTGSTMRENLLH
ncbi:NtaA/DmoA family FMN-dependent monooxygenase [Bradyrhizobium sp.]|uniref:NtaA/DmoA family FMN-dependent monooxygenase n=1 Tax=Bradyrhizobium sp. TaxID=376 RepID=UPI003C5A176E